MREFLFNLLFPKEASKLHRYQQATQTVWRWCGRVPNSAETARWIQAVGEGERGLDIENFRVQLENGTAARE